MDNMVFWLENPNVLIENYKLLPESNMSKNEQLNCLTRLVIVLYIMLELSGSKCATIFLLLSILMIILVYILKRDMFSENYKNFYAGPSTTIETNNNFVSENQKLVGKPNPKTLIQPKIVNPMYDITQRVSERNVPMGINKRTVQYLADSGYYVKDTINDSKLVKNYGLKTPVEVNENYIPPKDNKYDIKYRYSGEPEDDVNINCYYDKNNFSKYHIPNNIPSSECDEKDKDYNKRIYTQFIDPKVYTTQEIVGFPSTNIGISFQEPKYPVSVTQDDYGITFTEKDPNTYRDSDNVIEPNPYDDEPTYDEVYDPRSFGYGSQKRAYLDTKTGQPRYMYKDIDAVRRGNYFVRSNVDHLPFAQQSGLMRDNINTSIYGDVDKSYIDQNSQFRLNLQESLMSKRNAELWQLRKYPIRRDQGYKFR